MYLRQLYRDSLALLTDFYQLTMAYGYWKSGISNRKAVCHLFFRRNPFDGGFAIAAGLETVICFLETFRFEEEDIRYLRSLQDRSLAPLFDPAFLDMLADFRFRCTLHAVEEGEVVFSQEPLLRIEGTLLECQLLETPLLNLINFPTLIATKAARIRLAAGNDLLLEFGLRRAQGIDGALSASRAAFIGGADATSNVLAGKLMGIPVQGTHSHSWVMAFGDEKQAFYSLAKTLPHDTFFLVDTFSTREGVEHAIEVGLWLKEQGRSLRGVRLDSGDLALLSKEARKLLDDAGLTSTLIAASNELDELLIGDLKRQEAPIVIWGVGTRLVTSKEQSALDGVYKLSMVEDHDGSMRDTIKLSEQLAKISNPGILNIRRFSKDGECFADAIFDENLSISYPLKVIDPLDGTKVKTIRSGEGTERELLRLIFDQGTRMYNLPTLAEIRDKTIKNLRSFYSGVKRIHNPHQYIVGLEERLYERKDALIRNIRKGGA